MRADLREALASVQWAQAQIPVLQDRFAAWQRKGAYEILIEDDPTDGQSELLVAYPRKPLDPLIQAEAGAIINSARTALDLFMSALLTSNGKQPNQNANFPIRKAAGDFIDRVTMFEREKWITAPEAAAIKRTKAYNGGDHFLYAIHKLDILRKHERLITVNPVISDSYITAWGGGVVADLRHLNDKTILFRLPKGSFRPSRGNTNVNAEIFFNEPSLGVSNKPAFVALRAFTARIYAFVTEFP
jgi:hypothetical protein